MISSSFLKNTSSARSRQKHSLPTETLKSCVITRYFGVAYGNRSTYNSVLSLSHIMKVKTISYQPNPWGLYDMHGNACEWTRTTYKSYPYSPDDGRDYPNMTGRKVVRGGSWCDRPKRCRSAFRLSYPTWQRVHNVGFRVICKIETLTTKWLTDERKSA